MSSANETNPCVPCSQLTSTNSYRCYHCSTLFCAQCLIQHQHITVKHEFMNMIKQIDDILAQFLYHAHSQTEWTNHLTADRNRLEIFIKYIDNYYKNLPILALPSSEWVNHVKSVINKRSFAIYEDCAKILYPVSSSFIKSS